MKTAGFTLLELLISISILMVITGGILTGYNSFNDNRRVKEGATTLKTDLRLIQNKAQAAIKPPSGCTQLVGYRVTFTATTYQSQAICTSGAVGTIITSTLPASVSFSPIPSAFTFRVLTQGIDTSSSISITLVGLTKSYRIAVSPNGDINDHGYL